MGEGVNRLIALLQSTRACSGMTSTPIGVLSTMIFPVVLTGSSLLCCLHLLRRLSTHCRGLIRMPLAGTGPPGFERGGWAFEETMGFLRGRPLFLGSTIVGALRGRPLFLASMFVGVLRGRPFLLGGGDVGTYHSIVPKPL